MRLSVNWLNDFVNTDGITSEQFCDGMTDSGSKVEEFEELGSDIVNVVVGKITEIVKHPDSDHLLICQLDCGEGELRQIVTGAPNVFEGAIVPVAKAPSTLPNGVTIKAGKLRGVESNGMLCSIGELGLTEHDMPGSDNSGILILNGYILADTALGSDIRDVLMLKDTSVEFEITSNRPDCLSVIGLAREAKVTFGREMNVPTPKVTEAGGSISDYLSVDVDAPDLCSRYAARVVKNVKIGPSPIWMRMRLRASGVRPINNIVDITNYVMLEYGQPMHAFDYSMLDGSHIIVRRAADGEVFRSLDDQEHVLKSSNLVIADEKKAVALAGVMGGLNSEIKDDTATVVFESACFDGASVRLTAKSQGMKTESSSRFEKGLDPENCMPALERACELVQMLGAGEIVGGVIDVYKGKKSPVVLPLEVERYNEFLGVDLSEEYVIKVLTDLGFEIVDAEEPHFLRSRIGMIAEDRMNKLLGEIGLKKAKKLIISPSWRIDIGEMNDIAEEIIRIYGYNKIEATPFSGVVMAGLLTPAQAYRRRLHELLVGMGYYQSNTFSFVSRKNDDRIALPEDSQLRNHVVIINPLGEDTSVMRTSLLPCVLEVLEHNNAHKVQNAAIYELSHIYIPDESADNLPAEPFMLAMAFYGDGDFYTLKGQVEAILADSGINKVKFEACDSDPTFHPGRCASIIVRGSQKIGVMGQIHPTVAQNYGISAPIYAAYLPVDTLFEISDTKKQYKQLPKFPAVSRDFSFITNLDLEVGAIDECIRRSAGKLLEKTELFDIYTGEKMPAGLKSVSYRITFRSPDHTLTDEEVSAAADKILAGLDKQLGIKIRQ